MRLMLTALAAMETAVGGAMQPPAQTDSMSSRLTETRHVFHCGDARATLRYSEAVNIEGPAPTLADRWRVRNASLSVQGRVITPADQRRLGIWLHRFAWIERATLRCAGQVGDLYFNVEGMEAEAWAAFGEGRLAQRPARTSLGFRLSRSGQLALN